MPRRLHIVFAFTAAMGAAVALSSCVGSVNTPARSQIEPLPPSVHVVHDEVGGCKENESGFQYRYLVLDTTDISANGPLSTHLRASGYTQTILVDTDLPWVSQGWEPPKIRVRLEIGRLSDYLATALPHQGPLYSSLDPQIREHPEKYTLVAMRPTDFQCETPT